MRYHTDNGTPVHRSRCTGRAHPRLTRLVAHAIREADGPWSTHRRAALLASVRMLILAESGSPQHRRFVRDVVAARSLTRVGLNSPPYIVHRHGV